MAIIPSPLPTLDNLDTWLAARESAVKGLRPGLAAGVVWANPQKRQKTPLALVYLHGYTASRGELFPAPDRIAQHVGANLFYARLTGHGVGPDGHRTCRVEDWENDTLEALALGRLLGDRVVVMATSTGGTLATWLTLGPNTDRPDAVILVSPNLTVKNRGSELLLLPGREGILQALMGSTVSEVPLNKLNEEYWDCEHHSHSLIPMMDLVARVRRYDFRQWSVPALVVFDPLDPVVDATVTRKLFSRSPQSRVTLREWAAAPGDHHHVLAGDALSPQGTEPLVRRGVEFIQGTFGIV